MTVRKRLKVLGSTEDDGPDPLAAWRGRPGVVVLILFTLIALPCIVRAQLRDQPQPSDTLIVHTVVEPKVRPHDRRDKELETRPAPIRDWTQDDRVVLDVGGFFDPSAFDDAKVVQPKAYVHLMPGIPNTAFFGSAVGILLLSFVAFERYGKRVQGRIVTPSYPTFELTRFAPLRWAIKQRWFQPLFQIPVVLVFLGVIVAGLIGSQQPGRNIAPVLTWNVWWIGLIFSVVLAGNLWCFVCPWTAIPDWFMRLSLTRVSAIRGWHRKYPRFVLWLWPAIVLLLFVTWLEIIYDAGNRPWVTSVLGIGMIILAWLALLLFERKAMCRYLCFVGRVSGQYAMLGMLELRRRDHATCTACKTKDCYHGHPDRGLPCPTHEFMGAMNDSQYCTLCTECVKSCPHDNIALRVRPPGVEVLFPHRTRMDEAHLALVILIISAFHGAAMTPRWMTWEGWLRTTLIARARDLLGGASGLEGHLGGTITFTLMMGACVLGPALFYWALCWLIRCASLRRDVPVRRLFVRFAYSLLPIALVYHLAHNATHIFYEWSKLWRLASDPLGWGSDWFGTARAPLSPLWSPEAIWSLQVVLVLAGHVFSSLVAQREASRLFGTDRSAAWRANAMMLAGMILLSLLSLWLLAQPMFMRTAG